ncbi:MAG: hypothetical protein QOG87_2495 [Actinomycetota bacterium]|jgi:hypothetical protein
MTVVAIVAAKDRAGTVGETVAALRGLPLVDQVLVVDDGSGDGTAEAAHAAGAAVLRLPDNRGKGAAVSAGVAAIPDADVYLLVDDDTGATAALAERLLPPVLAGTADMTVAVLPSAGAKGGFGTVAEVARRAIQRASGFEPRAPLSGQRAVRGPLLRSLLPLADRFGLETGLTIDAVRAGATVTEVEVAMDHAHTGRSLAGFRHRANQGRDVLRAAWSRLTSPRQRIALMVVVSVLALAAGLGFGASWEPPSEPLAGRYDRVVLFGMPHLSLDDIDTGLTPNLDGLINRGSLAAMSVRTVSGQPSTTEAYATLGAGARVRANADGGYAFDADEQVQNGVAADLVARLTGTRPNGKVVVAGGPAVERQNKSLHLPSEPGALGLALNRAKRAAAVVGNADMPGILSVRTHPISRPVGGGLMDTTYAVDRGDVGTDLLRADPNAPYGVRADPAKLLDAVRAAVADAAVVLVDSGDLDRADAIEPQSTPPVAGTARRTALRRTDALLGDVERVLPPRTLLIAFAPVPRTTEWQLTPVVVAGEGVPHGYVHSPSTKRAGVVTITDLAPTVLDAIGAPVDDGMVGHAFRYRAEPSDIGFLRGLDRDTVYRETVYRPVTTGYVIVQVLLYLFAIFVLSRREGPGLAGGPLRFVVLAAAAFPLATFVARAIPGTTSLGGASVLLLIALSLGIAAWALRSRRHPLSPLGWIMGATALVIVLDVATGSRLHTSSILGYSLQSAGRFHGIPNTTFAVLTACTLLGCAMHVQYAPRRREALIAVALAFLLVIVADGAPGLGDDAGGILALVPLFALTLYGFRGTKIRLRTLALIGVATAVALALAAGVDLLRPPEARTHLGRFAASLFDGNGSDVLGTTILRKQAANFRILTKSVWTWVIPAAALFLLYVLVWERRGSQLLPRGSAIRVGLIASLAGSMLGFATNDSGPVVIALFFVYIGPYLTLLALEQEPDAEGVRISPPSPTVRPVTETAPAAR